MKHQVRLRAFAKVNLGLKILGQRADGYHEIRTVFQTVNLHDRLNVELVEGGRGIRVVCRDPEVPDGRANLAYRIAELWKGARKFRGGVRARLEKRIPVGAGLGGGSSDAAAMLVGLERLSGDQITPETRLRLAAEVGSDVPFFLWGGRALGFGRGERVYPLADLPPARCLIVFPGISVPTADAYREAGRRLGFGLTGRPGTSRMKSFGARPPFSLHDWGPAENDFETVIFARWPELARLKGWLIRAGAKTASLSGSGSALFAVFDSDRKFHRAIEFIPAGWKTFRTVTVPREEYQRRRFEE